MPTLKHSKLNEQGAGWGEALQAGQDLYGLPYRLSNFSILKHTQYLIILINLFISMGNSGTQFALVSIVLFLPNIAHEVARI